MKGVIVKSLSSLSLDLYIPKLIPFRLPISAISHFYVKTYQKLLKFYNRFLIFQEKVVSPEYAAYEDLYSKVFRLFIFLFDLINSNTAHKTEIRR